jgi:hypothetical protein
VQGAGFEETNAVCFVGRRGDKEAKSLVLSEDACEELCLAVRSIKPELVHDLAKSSLSAVQSDDGLLVLQSGIDYSTVKEGGFKPVFRTLAGRDGQDERKSLVAQIRLKGAWTAEPLSTNEIKGGPVIIVASDNPAN